MTPRTKIALAAAWAAALSFFVFMAVHVLHEGRHGRVPAPAAEVDHLLPEAVHYLESTRAIGDEWTLFCGVRYLGNSRPAPRIDLYVWEACQSYRVQGTKLATFTGWSVPAVISFQRVRGVYRVVAERQPGDGTDYWPDIRRMFSSDAEQAVVEMDGTTRTGVGAPSAIFARLQRRARHELLRQ